MKQSATYTVCLLAATLLCAAAVARGAQTCDSNITATAPDGDFDATAKDGTITHIATGLMWKMCSEGQTFNAASNTCSGTAASYTWQQALQRAQAVNQGKAGEALSRTDWRVPNIKELYTLVEQSCDQPAINAKLFPLTPAGPFWSSSPSDRTAGEAWTVDFTFGDAAPDGMTHTNHLRLVRGGF